MEKLNYLFATCKGGVFIEYNEHKLYNETVEQFLTGQGEKQYIDQEIWQQMIELDTIIGIEFYFPARDEPYSIYHYDLDYALDQCLEIVANQLHLHEWSLMKKGLPSTIN